MFYNLKLSRYDEGPLSETLQNLLLYVLEIFKEY